jgi:hypothetical protein
MNHHYSTLKILPTQGLEPRQFLRHCFDIAELTPRELLEEETDSQYRKKCITVLCAVLGVQRPTVRKWGSDLNFDGMPNYSKVSLAYIHTAEIVPKQLKSILRGEYNAPFVNAQTFLEKILLQGLSEQQVLQTVLRKGDRSELPRIFKHLSVARNTWQFYQYRYYFGYVPITTKS